MSLCVMCGGASPKYVHILRPEAQRSDTQLSSECDRAKRKSHIVYAVLTSDEFLCVSASLEMTGAGLLSWF